MAMATWQDLCIDAVDVAAQADFWAAVTGLRREGDLDHTHLVGPAPAHTIWVNEVDRPHVVKNRVHLDVDTGSVADLEALGARVLQPAEETGFGWTVMADPEGNEFCAFVREPGRLPDQRLHGVVIDCADPQATARWWGRLLGVEPVGDREHDWWTLEGVAADERMTLDFVPVPEPRTVPNRVHWDVVGDATAIIAAGARHLWDTEGWTTLADPDGNEFCVFAPPSD
jgi:catechol 2,3-dioxygenase-like lactoylglutathione lyase family enzyme